MLQYFSIRDGEELESLDKSRPFKCVVLVSQGVSKTWQHKVSERLVADGCLYMIAWGNNCSSWDDSVDIANIEQFFPHDIPEENFVMTTSHDDETLEDVLHFAKFSAVHPTIELKNVVVLDIGSSGREELIQTIFDSV